MRYVLFRLKVVWDIMCNIESSQKSHRYALEVDPAEVEAADAEDFEEVEASVEAECANDDFSLSKPRARNPVK